MRLERITANPLVATGKPCIRDLRFPVSRLLGLLAAGETLAAIPGDDLSRCIVVVDRSRIRRRWLPV